MTWRSTAHPAMLDSTRSNSNKPHNREAVRQRAAFLIVCVIVAFSGPFLSTNYATSGMLYYLLQFFEVIPATILQHGVIGRLILDILRYADVSSVCILENELAVGGHALGSLCIWEVFDDLDAVSRNFVVEQERL